MSSAKSPAQSLKTLVKRSLHSFGYELHKTPTLLDFLSSREIDVVLDVGANTGQFAMGLREAGYRGRMASFEPVARVHAQLEANAAGDARWSTHRCALGTAEGTAQINISRNTVFSSLLSQSDLAVQFDPDAAVTEVETIQVRRLDDFFATEYAAHNVFLKIDTQGFEPQVLEGAAESLARIQGVQLEVPIEHLYHGTWTLESALVALKRYGFVLAQVRPTNVLRHDPVSFVELDCVFRRA